MDLIFRIFCRKKSRNKNPKFRWDEKQFFAKKTTLVLKTRNSGFRIHEISGRKNEISVQKPEVSVQNSRSFGSKTRSFGSKTRSFGVKTPKFRVQFLNSKLP
jgi:hypothetical protein